MKLKYRKIVFKYWKYILNTLKSVSKYIWFGKGMPISGNDGIEALEFSCIYTRVWPATAAISRSNLQASESGTRIILPANRCP